MKLSWMFGSSMEAHHLLYAYLSVWAIQGGFCAWVLWNWLRTPKGLWSGTAIDARRLLNTKKQRSRRKRPASLSEEYVSDAPIPV